MLLRVSLRNHKSLRDEVVLKLSRPSFTTLRPSDGSWNDVTYRVGAIFGGNATGKSALVSGLGFVVDAIRFSSSVWLSEPDMVRHPFALTQESIENSSTYEIEFVYAGRRYVYRFEIDGDGVVAEELRDVATIRWRTIFSRRRGQKTFFHRLLNRIDVTDRELVLSRALLTHNEPLEEVATALVEGITVLNSNKIGRQAGLRRVTQDIESGRLSPADVSSLLRAADAGVNEVSVEQRPMPWHPSVSTAGERDTSVISTVPTRPVLTFTHRGAAEVSPLKAEDESDGTLAWLALAVPALSVLRQGGVIVVDEIDASLHPHLVDVLLGAFADEDVNRHGAQLLFTSHDTHLLSPRAATPLDQGQVWVVDKGIDGASEVVSLDEYPRHPDANLEKRYLQGRYGGVPRLSPSVLAALVED